MSLTDRNMISAVKTSAQASVDIDDHRLDSLYTGVGVNSVAYSMSSITPPLHLNEPRPKFFKKLKSNVITIEKPVSATSSMGLLPSDGVQADSSLNSRQSTHRSINSDSHSITSFRSVSDLNLNVPVSGPTQHEATRRSPNNVSSLSRIIDLDDEEPTPDDDHANQAYYSTVMDDTRRISADADHTRSSLRASVVQTATQAWPEQRAAALPYIALQPTRGIAQTGQNDVSNPEFALAQHAVQITSIQVEEMDYVVPEGPGTRRLLWFDSVVANMICLALPFIACLPLLLVQMWQYDNHEWLLRFRLSRVRSELFAALNAGVAVLSLVADGTFVFFLLRQTSVLGFWWWWQVICMGVIYISALGALALTSPLSRIWSEMRQANTGRVHNNVEAGDEVDDRDRWNDFKTISLHIYADPTLVAQLDAIQLLFILVQIVLPIEALLRVYLTPLLFEYRCYIRREFEQPVGVVEHSEIPPVHGSSRVYAPLPNLTLVELVSLLPYHYYGGLVLTLFIQTSHLIIITYIFLFELSLYSAFIAPTDGTVPLTAGVAVFLMLKGCWGLGIVLHAVLLELPLRRHYHQVFADWLGRTRLDYASHPALERERRDAEQQRLQLTKTSSTSST